MNAQSAPLPPIELPGLMLTATEPVRALIEFFLLAMRAPALAAAPRGDGHVVMVLPGFATADPMTVALRQYLRYLGYEGMPWGLGINTGFERLGDDIALLRRRLTDAHKVRDRKVSLIGWSLGGIMARRLAREHPEMVRQVISLGAPFTGNSAAVAIRRVYEWASGEVVGSPEGRARWERDRAAPRIPTVAIWSRADGITNWQNCVEEPADHIRNIEVGGSHLGLAHNPDVLLAIAHILAESDERG